MPFEVLRCYLGLALCFLIVLFAAGLLIFQKKALGMKEWIISNIKWLIPALLFIAVAGRFIAVFAYFGVHKYVRDFEVFVMWGNLMVDNGFKEFLSEYPAGSLYIFAGLRYILRLVGAGNHMAITHLVMKAPFIISEVMLSRYLFKQARKTISEDKAFFIFLIFLFNPAFILNSSMWGQIDGLLTLLVVLSFITLQNKKIIQSILFYTFACLIKAQAIFFAPVFGMYVLIYLFNNKMIKKHILKVFIGAVLGILIFFLSTLPFKENIWDVWLITFFKRISGAHPSNTIGATNFFGIFGGNGISNTEPFLFMNYEIWGNIFLALICAAMIPLTLYFKEDKKHLLLAAFCMAAIFTLGHSMHERYILPSIALYLAAYIFTKRKEMLILSVLYTAIGTIIQSMVLFDLFGGKTWTFKMMSVISVGVFIYSVLVIAKTIKAKKLLNQQ